MDYQNSQLFISYKHLQAKTTRELETQMLQIQIDAKKPITFSPPTYNNKTNKYETWYLHDWSKDIRPSDKLEMGKGVINE